MAYVYQIVVLDPRTTLLIKCRAIYMATLTGSRNMHHWTFTLNLNFATGMWKQTFHDDLECHKLMFEKISVQHVLSTHALMSKGPDQGRLKKGLGFSKWRVCLKNCSFWEVCVDQFYFEQCHSQDNMIGHTETIFAAVHRGHFIIARRGKHDRQKLRKNRDFHVIRRSM